MTKDKLNKLIKYQSELKDKLTNPIPEKHKDNPASYKAFLNNELRLVTSKIEQGKLLLGGK